MCVNKEKTPGLASFCTQTGKCFCRQAYHTSHPPQAKLPLKGCWQRVFIKVTPNAGSPAQHHCPSENSLCWRGKKKSRAHLGKPQLRLELCAGLVGLFPSAAQTSARLWAVITLLLPLFLFHFLLQLLCVPRPLLSFMS